MTDSPTPPRAAPVPRRLRVPTDAVADRAIMRRACGREPQAVCNGNRDLTHLHLWTPLRRP